MNTFIFLTVALVLGQLSLHAQLPIITNQPVSQAVWKGCNATFSLGVSNMEPFTYQWQQNSTNIPNNIISTVAGGGSGGDGSLAIDASLGQIYGSVAMDTAGNLYIPDFDNHRVRKVNTAGIITTVAGGGSGGIGGAATNASLIYPSSVALDASGNLFISDNGGHRIYKVSNDGIITTIAGNGSSIYSGDGGSATNAGMKPNGITVDAVGNLFIADANSRIRKVNTAGIITTVAGGGSGGDGGAATNASLNYPFDVKMDSDGNMFIAESANQRIRKVSTNGIITTIAGGGASGSNGIAATNASLNYPSAVALDKAGNIFIADTSNHCIRRVDTNGLIATVAGYRGYTGNPLDGYPATNAYFYYTYGVMVDDFGNLFISDEAHNRIRKVTNTQGSSLALNSLTPANAGNYRMIVTSVSGSVTSSVVNLIVATTPLIYQTLANFDRSFSLNIVSQPASTNVVLSTTNLSPPVVWQPISTNIAGINGNWQFTDTNTSSYKIKFYRSSIQ